MEEFLLRNSYFAKIPQFSIGILAFFLVWYSQNGIEPKSHSPSDFISPPRHLKHLVAGYTEVVADVMWIRTIQDLDYCDQSIGENICRNNSWLYLMLETITELAPSFRMPYSAGALALTVMITDIDGATKIFDKAVTAFPNDWKILFTASYHYLYEVKDKKHAAELLVRAARNGAPPFTFTLAGRLYSDSGHLDLAESLLESMIAEKQDPILIKRLRDKIAQIKSESQTKKSSQ